MSEPEPDTIWIWTARGGALGILKTSFDADDLRRAYPDGVTTVEVLRYLQAKYCGELVYLDADYGGYPPSGSTRTETPLAPGATVCRHG